MIVGHTIMILSTNISRTIETYRRTALPLIAGTERTTTDDEIYKNGYAVYSSQNELLEYLLTVVHSFNVATNASSMFYEICILWREHD